MGDRRIRWYLRGDGRSMKPAKLAEGIDGLKQETRLEERRLKSVVDLGPPRDLNVPQRRSSD